MQVRQRCYSCSTPFVVKPDEVDAALDQIFIEKLKYYNALCPKCGKANKISKKQLKRAAPNWEPPKQTE